jgi:hypothetical protein
MKLSKIFLKGEIDNLSPQIVIRMMPGAGKGKYLQFSGCLNPDRDYFNKNSHIPAFIK